MRESRETVDEPDTRLGCGCGCGLAVTGGEAGRGNSPETIRAEALLARLATLADDADRARERAADTDSVVEVADAADAVRL